MLMLRRRHLGQRHDGGVLELAGGGALGEVGGGQQRELLWLLLLGHHLRLLLLHHGLGLELMIIHHLLLLGEIWSLMDAVTRHHDLGLTHRTPGGLDSEGGRGEASALQRQLVHPLLDHVGILTRSRGLQSILQLSAKLLTVRGKVEEVLTLLERRPLLLGELGQLPMSVLPPLVTKAISAKCVFVESVQVILRAVILKAHN